MSDAVEDIDAEIVEQERGPIDFVLTSTGQRFTIPTPYLSVSQAQMYAKCPRQFFYRYVMKIKEKPDFARVIGGSGHFAMAEANRHKRKTGKDFSGKRLKEAFGDHWAVLRKTVKPDLSEKKVTTALSQALDEYAETTAPSIQPTIVEERFDKTFDGVPVMGFIDVVSGVEKPVVLDYKFSTSRTPVLKPEIARQSLQVATYAAVAGAKSPQT